MHSEAVCIPRQYAIKAECNQARMQSICLLPIAYCLLPIAYCLLPIAFAPLIAFGQDAFGQDAFGQDAFARWMHSAAECIRQPNAWARARARAPGWLGRGAGALAKSVADAEEKIPQVSPSQTVFFWGGNRE